MRERFLRRRKYLLKKSERPGTDRRKQAMCRCLCLLVLAGLLLSGCGRKGQQVMGIAEQFGIAYAPLQIMREQKLLEKRLPGVEIQWKQFGGPTGIREAMLNGEINFGFMGVAPVIVGKDSGMEWRYATGISANDVAVVASDPKVTSLKDFTEKDRIAILSPACTQHVLLCMLAREELGDAHALDNQLVSMSHPDSVSALLSGTEITAHVSTPPYITQEVNGGAHVIADGEDIMGGSFTFITGVAMEDFYREHRDWYDAFLDALGEAIDYINENREEAVALLAPIYGITEEELAEQMGYDGTIYSMELRGVEKLNKAMYEMGFVGEERSMEELVFENVVVKE